MKLGGGEVMEDKKPEVLIVGDDEAAMQTSEVLTESSDVLMVGPKRSCGYIGGGYVAAAISAIYALSHYGGLFDERPMRRRQIKEMKKCLLPPCGEYTSHNSGYCSPGCKAENRKRIKK